MITAFKQTYIDALKQYYFVGGMPEAVQRFAEERDFNEVRGIQKHILEAYEQDFSKREFRCVLRWRIIKKKIGSSIFRSMR